MISINGKNMIIKGELSSEKLRLVIDNLDRMPKK